MIYTPYTMTPNLLEIAKHVRKTRAEYLKQSRRLKKDKSYLFIARHYNSDSPAVPGIRPWVRPFNVQDSEARYEGGGYFIAHGGVGIAIDPGYNFLALLYQNGFTVKDIDYVIVTHDHIDHHADLDSIIALKRSDPLTILACINICKSFGLRRSSSPLSVQPIEIVYKPTTRPYKIKDEYGNVRAKISPLPTLHWQRVFKELDPDKYLQYHMEGGFGLSLSLQPFSVDMKIKKIVITSDTLFPLQDLGHDSGYFWNSRLQYLRADKRKRLGLTLPLSTIERERISASLSNKFNEFIERYKNEKDIDLICLHIGSMEKERCWSNNPWGEGVYDGYHLGFLGCQRLLNLLPDKGNLKLAMVTEFGEELVGHRKNICQALSDAATFDYTKHSGGPMKPLPVLPADVGFRLNLNSGHIRCDGCGEEHPISEICAEETREFIRYLGKHIESEYILNCQWKE